MSILRRLVPLALVAVVLALWQALRPANRDARLVEFPVALVLVALAIVFAVRAPRARTASTMAEPLRRHEQVVRDIPDPQTRPLEQALDGWIATGAGAEDAASILARAGASQPDISRASTRRKREAILRKALSET